MICITYNVRGGKALPCTKEELTRARAMVTPESANQLREITEQMVWVDKESALYKQLDEEKKKIKLARPALLIHACKFDDDERKNDKAHPSGLIFFDVDHFKDDIRKFYEECIAERVKELSVALVEISPSGDGFHAAFVKPDGMTIAEAQKWFAEQLGVNNDTGTFDLARSSFCVGEDYVLYQDDDLLFGEREISEEELALYRINKVDGKKEVPISTADIEILPTTFSLKAWDLCLTETGLTQAEVDIPGERNWHNTLKAILSVGICQIVEKDQLLAVLKMKMPNYYETEDCRRLVTDFYKNYTDENGRMTLTLRNIYTRALKESTKESTTVIQGEDAEGVAESVLTLPPLPRLLQILVSAYPEEYRPAVVMSSLVFIGTLMTKVRFRYLDGSTQSPSFLCCVSAPQASGKSFTRKLYNLLTEPIRAMDMIGREKERQYNEKKRSAKNSKQQPEDPRAVIRLIPATASNAMILKRADYAQGLHLCTYAEEIDTLTKGKKAGAWSEKSDLYRMAFDNAEWGQDYMSDNSYSGQVKLFYNLLVCGTPNAVGRFFNDVEDGLVSRVMFVELPDMLGAKMPKFGAYTHRDLREVKAIIEDLFNLCGPKKEVYEDREDELFVSSKVVENAIDEWLEEKRQEYLQNQDNPALDVFRRRAAVIGFRAGMVAHVLNNRKNAKQSAEFALWVANFVLNHQLNVFGERMNQVMIKVEEKNYASHSGPRKGRNVLLFESLNDNFSENDVIMKRQSLGLFGPVGYIIRRWVQNGLCRRVDATTWAKIN